MLAALAGLDRLLRHVLLGLGAVAGRAERAQVGLAVFAAKDQGLGMVELDALTRRSKALAAFASLACVASVSLPISSKIDRVP